MYHSVIIQSNTKTGSRVLPSLIERERRTILYINFPPLSICVIVSKCPVPTFISTVTKQGLLTIQTHKCRSFRCEVSIYNSSTNISYQNFEIFSFPSPDPSPCKSRYNPSFIQEEVPNVDFFLFYSTNIISNNHLWSSKKLI